MTKGSTIDPLLTMGSTINIKRYQSIKLHSVHKFLLQLQTLLVSFRGTVMMRCINCLASELKYSKDRRSIAVPLRLVIRPRVVVQGGVVHILRLHRECCILDPLSFHVAEDWVGICGWRLEGSPLQP